jgi:SAM-dependent methyltransferase
MMGFLDRIHPERSVAGFTRLDGTVLFYNFVKAALCRTDSRRILDFGAGRGATEYRYGADRRELQDLRQFGGEVWAADIDPVVREHPASHHQVVLQPDGPLPFEDGFFDLIVSDFTFEHIAHPEQVAPELLRILKPGGFICARTANKYGYIKLAASLVPNALHVRALNRIQPDREDKDVFPTVYKMNSVHEVRRLFPGCEVSWYRDNAEPAYYFGNSLLYRAFLLVHKLFPELVATSICFFIRKDDRAA